MSKRVAKNAGSFYPNSKEKIEEMIKLFNEIVDNSPSYKDILELKPKAIISPHAGYIYSGFSANLAHRLLAKRKVKRVVVIGPSHHVAFKGISAANYEYYQTPIKDLKIDRDYLQLMAANFDIKVVSKAHELEHSTETQMPFIAHYQGDVEVIELIYSDVDYSYLSKLITWLLEDSLTSVVISTDLSHFHSLDKANVLDSICIQGIEKKSIALLDTGCEACGITGVKAITKSATTLNLEPKILDYRTSADITDDKSSVVGYLSVGYM